MAEGQDGSADGNDGSRAVLRGAAPKPPEDRRGWAADHVPVIVLAVVVLVLMIVGAMSNDDVTCPGGASSCGAP